MHRNLIACITCFLLSVLIIKADAQRTSSTESRDQIPDCRETNTINKAGIADAYPYLTGDGLRLYFTSNREGGHGRIFISTRQSIKDPFEEPKALSPNLPDGYYAGTLTADELTLCLVKTGSMYISTRSNLNSPFGTPVKITGAYDTYHYGPSISPDGKEIIVMEKTNNNYLIRIYRRLSAYQVVPAGDLPVPEGTPGPGQFSKDGLYYFFSIEKNEDEKEYLWKYIRPTIDDGFADLQELPVKMESLKNNLQPSVNADGSIVVFVTSPNNRWESDDIVLINNTSRDVNAPEKYASVESNNNNTMKVMNKITAADLKVYPNPFSANVIIELSTLPESGAVINVFDLSGKKLKQEKITQLRTTLNLGHFIAGMYIYHVVNSDGQLISSGKLVKGN
jgi:hypothetical protein